MLVLALGVGERERENGTCYSYISLYYDDGNSDPFASLFSSCDDGDDDCLFLPCAKCRYVAMMSLR